MDLFINCSMKIRSMLLFTLLTFCLQAWPQGDHYSVYALKFAAVGHPLPISVWADHGPDKDSVNIDFMIWLIKGEKGKNILVDAGFLPGLEDAKDFDVVGYKRPDSVLSKVGLKAE